MRKIPEESKEAEKPIGWQPKSRYCLGVQAFSKILELMDHATHSGHKVRSKLKVTYIIRYFADLETLFIPLRPVLQDNDKKAIEGELKALRKNNIFVYKRRIKGDKTKIVERLTNIEKDLYDAMQNIDMYIVLQKKRSLISRRTQLREHIEGTGIPDLEDEFL